MLDSVRHWIKTCNAFEATAGIRGMKHSECPSAEDGMERFACPSPDRMGRYRCIDDHVLCDGFIDCPQGEDEDRMSCMFYKTGYVIQRKWLKTRHTGICYVLVITIASKDATGAEAKIASVPQRRASITARRPESSLGTFAVMR
ncbi:hypothetical protein MRX96_018231 [Rhipicephalus microplus]